MLRRCIWLVPILLLAAVTRLRFIRYVVRDNELVPIGPDSFYHLWRIEAAVAKGGLPPHFDPFINAPDGARVIYPDGFAWILAQLARLVFGVDAARVEIQWAAMMGCVGLGVLVVWATYLIARALFGDRAAIAAALIAALLPLASWSGMFGQVDHHTLELFLSALALVAILRGGRWHLATMETCPRRVGGVVISGLSLAALHYSVPTAPIHILLVLAGVEVALCRAAHQGETASATPIAVNAASAFALGALLCLPDLPLRQGFVFYQPSLLTPTLLFVSMFLVLGTRIVVMRLPRKLVFPFAALGAAAGTGTLFILFPEAINFIRGQGIIRLVAETQPIWREFRANLEMHGLLILLAPLCFIVVAKFGDVAAWGMIAYGICSLGLTAFQLRFGYMLATAEAVLCAGAATLIWPLLQSRRIVRWAAAALTFAPFVWVHYWIEVDSPSERAIREAATWLATHTPSHGAREELKTTPYSVLVPWATGAQIAYWAQRPVIASGFFHGDYAPGIRDTVDLFYSEADPDPLLDRRAVKYIVVYEEVSDLTDLYLKLNPRTGKLLRLPLQTQLYENNGNVMLSEPEDAATPPRIFPALGNLRLVFTSTTRLPDGKSNRPALKIFERIAGATVTGNCSGQAVQGIMTIPVDESPPIEFVSWAPCHGVFQLMTPYSGTLRLTENTHPERILECVISEDDAIQGKILRCDW